MNLLLENRHVSSGGTIRFREFSPCLPLRPHVACFWNTLTAPNQKPYPLRVLPDGCTDIIFSLPPRAPSAVVIGPMRQSRLGVSQHSTSIGVRFYPGTALTFLGHSLADMQERVVPLNELWGASANRLLDQLIATGSFTQRIAIIEDQLLAQLRRSTLSDSHVTHAIKWIYADRGRPQVRDLAKAVGLCERQLSRKFPIWTGYTPKQFVRVLRFQHALESILHSPATGAATIAAQHGYADQSHMINEFAELGGGTPRALRHAAVSMTDECPIFSIPTPGTMRYHRAP